MRKIKCSNPECKATWGHLLGNKTIDLGRKDQQIMVMGQDFQLVGTCPKCGLKTTAIVESGQLSADDLTFKDDTTDDDGNVIKPAGSTEPVKTEEELALEHSNDKPKLDEHGEPIVEEPAPKPRKFTA